MASFFDRLKKDPESLGKAWKENNLQEMERLVSGKGCLHTHYVPDSGTPDQVPLAMIAARHNRVDVLEMLHRHRVRLDALSINGEKLARNLLPEMSPVNIWHKLARPLDLAVRENHAEAVRFLHNAGVNVSARAPGTGHTAMHVALIYDRPQMIELLVELGADINARDKRLQTALHWAYHSNSWKSRPIDTLLKLGANPNMRDHANRSPLSLALSSGELASASALLDYGADITHHERSDCEDRADRHELLDQYEDYRRMRQETEPIPVSSSRTSIRL